MHFDPLVKKTSDANHLSGPLRKRKFTSTGSKDHCLWFVIGGFRSVLWVSVFQGSLLVILLWPKPDVKIPNIFDRFHLWTSDFQIAMRQFTCLDYVSTYCVPITHLRQNKPFPLLCLGHAQIIKMIDGSSNSRYWVARPIRISWGLVLHVKPSRKVSQHSPVM